MRPRLRSDVRYAPVPDGAYVHGDYGGLVLPGAQAYMWLDRLVPFLTGDHELADLTASLTVGKRAVIERLVRTLQAGGFVSDARDDLPHSLTSAECETYAGEIAFIQHVLDSAAHRFARHRAARYLVRADGAGTSGLLVAVAEAGLAAGWRQATVVPGDDMPGMSARLAALPRRDPAQEIEIVPRQQADVAVATGAVDVVLHLASEEARAALAEVARCCAIGNVALGQLLLGAGEAWLTRVAAPATTCAESGWLRLRGAHAAEPAVNWLTGPIPALLASWLSLAAFTHTTGMDELPPAAGEPASPAICRISLRDLATSWHPVVPHPLADLGTPLPAAGIPARRHPPEAADDTERERAVAAYRALAEIPAVTGSGLLASVRNVTDEHTGLITSLGECDLPQLPLSMCQATVADPFGTLPEWAPAPAVMGCGPGSEQARQVAALAALATYGTLATIWEAAHQDRHADTVWGLDLATREPVAVPWQETSLPAGRTLVPFEAPVGTAAGLTWDGCVMAALVQHCESLLRELVAADPEAGDYVEPRALADGTAGTQSVAAMLVDYLAKAGEAPVARNVSAMLGVPAYQIRLTCGTRVVACGDSPAAALTAALGRAVAEWQITLSGRVGAAGRMRTSWSAGIPASSGAEPAVASFVAALRRLRLRPVGVALHGDPEAVRILPHVVRVVLRDDTLLDGTGADPRSTADGRNASSARSLA